MSGVLSVGVLTDTPEGPCKGSNPCASSPSSRYSSYDVSTQPIRHSGELAGRTSFPVWSIFASASFTPSIFEKTLRMTEVSSKLLLGPLRSHHPETGELLAFSVSLSSPQLSRLRVSQRQKRERLSHTC